MANFTPVSAAIGGVLIGLSAVLLMLFTGHIAGVSGIFGGLINPQTSDRSLTTTPQSVGLPPPSQSEQFCSVTVIDAAYIKNLASVRAARKTATYRILRFPQLAA
jgi:uncharacterized membrane protein YedE/YeeE